MEDNASQAIMIAFALIVFAIGISTTMFMFNKLSSTAEYLTFHTDETNFYDNVAVVGTEGIERYVNFETVIPTLYRYYKEHFCVKIYDATNEIISGSSEENPVLIQLLDVNLEGKVEKAAKDSNLKRLEETGELKSDYAPTNNRRIIRNEEDILKYYEPHSLKKLYDNKAEYPYLYMFGAPWLGSTDDMKLRLDYFINGSSGYINNQFVDYTNHPFNVMIKKAQTDITYQFKEKFVSYSYTGETMETEDGDILVTGANSKDKIVITYTFVKIKDDETVNKLNIINEKK